MGLNLHKDYFKKRFIGTIDTGIEAVLMPFLPRK
jgi:hypothetical protein